MLGFLNSLSLPASQCLKNNVPSFKAADSMRCSVFVSDALNPGVTSGVKGKVKEMVSGTREASKRSWISAVLVVLRLLSLLPGMAQLILVALQLEYVQSKAQSYNGIQRKQI